MNLNKTDISILELCARTYRALSCLEISKTTGLHKTTVNQRLDILVKRNYLKRTRDRTSLYRYDFSDNTARKFRLFADSEDVAALGNKKIKEFVEKHRTDENIEACLIYGSVLTTKDFNDIDILVIYKHKKIEIKDIDTDLFQLDAKSFRELYALGEPRLQAALINGRILIDREFIFNYFENDLPISASDDVIETIDRKYSHITKTLEAVKKEPLENLKKMHLNALETKAIILFMKNKIPIPPRTQFLAEVRKIDKGLAKRIEDVQKVKTPKEFWELFYA
ncbi:MAG: winged helix-turn-helix transcriptional regulator [Candidatus Aenigmarchaeota archaeon]|nr:winged helix-turn-helix transcriptional regulator [Candidatus Aenigmarchaeota archaeon]